MTYRRMMERKSSGMTLGYKVAFVGFRTIFGIATGLTVTITPWYLGLPVLALFVGWAVIEWRSASPGRCQYCGGRGLPIYRDATSYVRRPWWDLRPHSAANLTYVCLADIGVYLAERLPGDPRR